MSTRYVKLNFLPGFHRESTQYSEEGVMMEIVCFREGKPEIYVDIKNNTVL